jgi:hypothetical protein
MERHWHVVSVPKNLLPKFSNNNPDGFGQQRPGSPKIPLRKVLVNFVGDCNEVTVEVEGETFEFKGPQQVGSHELRLPGENLFVSFEATESRFYFRRAF